MVKITFNHCGMTCKDPHTFERFYNKHFGFKRSQVFDIGGGKQIVMLKNDEGYYLEVFYSESELPIAPPENDGWSFPGIRHLAFKVDNVDEKLAEMGEDAVVSLGPLDFDAFIPGWRTVWLKDPEGNIVEISQGYKDPATAPAPLD
jgi:glyoxylase I family protein